MPFIPVPNTALVELRSTLDGQDVENTLWFDFGVEPTASDLSDLGNLLLDWWVARIKPITSQANQLREVVVTDMTTESSAQVTVPAPGGTQGDATDEIMPGNVTVCVSFRTALRGRSFRGRNYFIGLTVGQVSGSQVISTQVDAITTAYGSLGADITGSGWTWVIASRYDGVDPTTGKPIPRAEGIVTPVQSVVVVDPIVDSQRRRLPGRGR